MYEFFFGNMDSLQLIVLMISALLIGINKTGIPGIGTLPVIMLTVMFPARFSTGLQLMMLCGADIMAVAYYHRSANWKIILRLLPCALCGIALGALTLHYIHSDEFLRIMIGIIIILMSLVYFVKTYLIKSEMIPGHFLFAFTVGMLAGFTTQIANAAGPVMAIYLLSMRLPKMEYMGTCSMYFMILNWLKLPIFVFEGRINTESFTADIAMIPFLLAGGVLGVVFIKKAPRKLFETVIQILVIISALWLLFGKTKEELRREYAPSETTSSEIER